MERWLPDELRSSPELRQQLRDQRPIERRGWFARRGREHEIVRFSRLADSANALKVIGDVAGGDQLAELVLPPHMQDDELAALVVGPDGNVTPPQILGLRRTHAGVAHDQNEIVGDGAIPCLDWFSRLLDPPPREGVELAVLLGRELLAAYLRQGELALKYLTLFDVLLAGGVSHDRAEDRHFGADRGVADAAIAPLAVLLPPNWVGNPPVLSDQIDLDGTDVAVKLGLDDGFDYLPSVLRDLPGLDAFLLKVRVVLGDLAEGPIEDRNLVLDAEAEIGVLVEGPLARRVDVGRLQGDRLVTVVMGELDPAVPIAVLHVRAAEDDKSGLEFLRVDKEGHGSAVCCVEFVFFQRLSA